ncbi:MAG: hypothetical protein ABI251_12100, partial [Mycobacteriaceae bacterium]
ALYRSVRVRAASDGRTVTSVVEEALRRLLDDHETRPQPFVLHALPARESHEDSPPIPFDLDDNSATLAYLDAAERRSGGEYWN